MKIVIYLMATLGFLHGCGEGNGTYTQNSPNPLPTFKTVVCGEIIPPTQGQSSSSIDFRIRDQNNNSFVIIAETAHVKNSLNNLTNYSDICLFSQKEIGQGYEGNVISAQQIKIRVDGSTQK